MENDRSDGTEFAIVEANRKARVPDTPQNKQLV
jgi:hypothetical protein